MALTLFISAALLIVVGRKEMLGVLPESRQPFGHNYALVSLLAAQYSFLVPGYSLSLMAEN
jgi:hypothetical protein